MVSGITRRMILAAVALPLIPTGARAAYPDRVRSEEHTSELQSQR